MSTHKDSKCHAVFRTAVFMFLSTFLPPTLFAQEEAMDEIVVTAPGPDEADHRWDWYYFMLERVRNHGTLDADMSIVDYYQQMADDYRECERLADGEVDQCKVVWSNEGQVLCFAGLGVALGFFGRYFPQGRAMEALAPGSLAAMLSCSNLEQVAHHWCETDLKTRSIQNCMDE